MFRYRRAATVEREQLKWLVYAGAIIVLGLLAEPVTEHFMGPTAAANNLQNALSSGGVALIPCAIGIAIFRYHLYDIDVVINKTLVYGSLAAFITAVYVAIVVGIGSLVAQHGDQTSFGLSIAATAVVAVAFQPVRARIQHLANRLVYGKRATPYEVLARVRRAHRRNLRHRGTAAPHGADPGRGHRGQGGRVAAGRGDVQGRRRLAARRGAVRRPVTACRRARGPGRRPGPAGALPGQGARRAVGDQAPGRVPHPGRGQAPGRPRRPGGPGAQERRPVGAADPGSRRSGPPGSAWSPRRTRNGAGSSATSTTAPSSSWSRWPSS